MSHRPYAGGDTFPLAPVASWYLKEYAERWKSKAAIAVLWERTPLMTPPIYPCTALKNKQREIKALADETIVYITENGYGNYIFVSKEVYERELQNAVEEALYEQRFAKALEASLRDIEQGRVYDYSREELWAEIERRHALRAQSGELEADKEPVHA